MRVTYVGTATVLLEIGGLRFLTDPALDPAGRRYTFRCGFSSTKVQEPVPPVGGWEPLEAVLVSHDHHADNLDEAGRALLPKARRVLTTPPGARRLGGNAVGLKPWDSVQLGDVRVTAVPARHGPPGIEWIDSQTTGFVLEAPEQRHGALWISGDTVYFPGLAEIGRRFKIGSAIVHLGGVRFGVTGPLLFTFDPKGAVAALRSVGCRDVIPVHAEGWTHFSEPRAEFARAFEAEGLGARWLRPGESAELAG